MSRVFEALTKAAIKQEPAELSVQKIEDEGRTVSPEQSLSAKVTSAVTEETSANSTNGRVYETHGFHLRASNDEKSWHKKFEELFFGWGLRRYSSYPIVSLERGSLAAEQYKILREQVKHLRAQSGIRSFFVSSPVKRDGKTTVAVNLAAALSLDYEEKVLLIDGDLRAPAIQGYFNVRQSPGLTEYLDSSSKIDLKNLVQETFLPGLRILPSGKPSYLASELLAKDRMKQMMDEARRQFPEHHIIIDSPPILSTPDPLVIARHVDGVLLVVRAGKTPREYLTKALQSLNSSKIMGVVLNGADLGISSKYYYYSTNGA